MKKSNISIIDRVTSIFMNKTKSKQSKSVMSDLLICMNQHPNDYEFGAEARVIIQKFTEDLVE